MAKTLHVADKTLAPAKPAVAQSQAWLAEARRVLDNEAEALAALRDKLGTEFLEALELMVTAKGRVVVTGMGKSGIIAQKIAATLSSTGTPACFLHPAEGAHGDLGMLMPGDVLLTLSNSGETPEILAILPTVAHLQVPMVAITRQGRSRLAQAAQVTLVLPIAREACPLNLAPTTSTTLSLALGDALAVALMKRNGFDAERFALYHPAGALGKRLLVRVADLMHTGEALPSVAPEASFLEALVEMSGKQLGMTTVLDANGRLVGILTDGDVRRAVIKQGETAGAADSTRMTVSELMSPEPATVTGDLLAADALDMMRARQITTLVVTADDGTGQPVGVLHLHDILRAGIER